MNGREAEIDFFYKVKGAVGSAVVTVNSSVDIGFPVIVGKRTYTCTLKEAEEWENMVEAFLKVEGPHGAGIVFFDTKYAMNRGVYEIGKA